MLTKKVDLHFLPPRNCATCFTPHSCYVRASENFWGCLPQYPPKNLGQIPAALTISRIFERFSPGQNGSEVWRQITLNSLTGPPTSGPFGPGENRSKMPEIARAAGIWPKFFGGYWARHPQKFSLALLHSNAAFHFFGYPGSTTICCSLFETYYT